MAEGVRRRLGATFGVATTGVAGPDPADGKPVGTVHIAASGQVSTVRRRLALAGGRRSIRDQAVLQSLLLLQGTLEAEGT
jgi:nicotinamide-nucleotide amidase